MPKRLGKQSEENYPVQPTPDDEILNKLVNESLSNHDNAIQLEDDDKGPAFPDPPEQQDMSLHSREFYEQQSNFVPAVEVTKKNEGFSDKDTKEQFNKLAGSKTAQPAQEVDLENLDESMIMNMPEIKASSFKIIDVLNPKPKDKSIRFRWANCKNYVAGNLGKYLAIGFQVASIDDVDQKKTPIDPSMIEGSQIKFYDVILLKINVVQLMGLYKRNILRSVDKLTKAKEKGLAEATRQFQAGVSDSPGASAAYNHYKQALGKEPVEFFATE